MRIYAKILVRQYDYTTKLRFPPLPHRLFNLIPPAGSTASSLPLRVIPASTLSLPHSVMLLILIRKVLNLPGEKNAMCETALFAGGSARPAHCAVSQDTSIFFNLVYKKIGVPSESLLRPHREAQPKAAVAEAGGVEATVRHPAVTRSTVPAAASVHAFRPTRRTGRVGL